MTRSAVLIRQAWRAFGLTVAIDTDAPDLFDLLAPQLPVFPRDDEASAADLTYRVAVRSTGGVAVLRGRRTLALAPDVPAASMALVTDLQSAIARAAAGFTFVHAGVVGVDGRALLLPARSFGGKSTLVAALVRAGADYGSDEFAVVDRAGRVHPYPRHLALRTADRTQRVPAGELGGRVMGDGVPVGAVVFFQFDAGADLTLAPLSPAATVLGLLRHCLGVRGRPAETMQALRAAASGAVGLAGRRGEAADAAGLLMAAARRGWSRA